MGLPWLDARYPPKPLYLTPSQLVRGGGSIKERSGRDLNNYCHRENRLYRGKLDWAITNKEQSRTMRKKIQILKHTSPLFFLGLASVLNFLPSLICDSGWWGTGTVVSYYSCILSLLLLPPQGGGLLKLFPCSTFAHTWDSDLNCLFTTIC